MGIDINAHLLLEYIAFFVGFRYYLYLRKNSDDIINSKNRISIILGAIVGAFIGSRLFAFLENPEIQLSGESILHILNSKTIMGGLFGGLIGVEISKKIIGEVNSSGDLFTLPLIAGIFIGRIGCFLSGTNEFTYGIETSMISGMDLGDGVLRHPIALYELIFLMLLYACIWKLRKKNPGLASGDLFKIFMLSYFGFRFLIEFIKPNIFFILGLSSIQWLCILCWVYYFSTLKQVIHNAYSKLYILRSYN